MSDAAEGLVDAEARIQERLEERRPRRRPVGPRQSPDQVRTRESHRLAKAELERQLSATSNAVRREQIAHAIAELERRIAEQNAAG